MAIFLSAHTTACWIWAYLQLLSEEGPSIYDCHIFHCSCACHQIRNSLVFLQCNLLKLRTVRNLGICLEQLDRKRSISTNADFAESRSTWLIRLWITNASKNPAPKSIKTSHDGIDTEMDGFMAETRISTEIEMDRIVELPIRTRTIHNEGVFLEQHNEGHGLKKSSFDPRTM